MKKVLLLAALAGATALPALAETLCSGESAEVKLDLATGTMRTPAATETLTYSTEWDGGSAVTLAANGETLASGLTGSGTYDWTPSGSGLFTLTHTTTTSGGDVVLTATFMTPPKYVKPVYVDDDAANGIDHWVTNTVPSGYTVVENSAARVTWGEAGATNWYIVIGDNVQIDGGVECMGDVRLVLCDGAKLTVTNVAENCAGIATDASGSFTIYGTPDGAGELSATAGEQGAGIGGGKNGAGSHITINGGTVNAAGGIFASSIGGGAKGTGSDITINGGEVTASGVVQSEETSAAAGIGGGNYGNGSNITINGGIVTAVGLNLSAGIGGGSDGDGSNITINDGVVKVSGEFGGAGIGGGSEGNGSNIAINGGTISAITCVGGAAIGGGQTGTGSNIRIANAAVSVQAVATYYEGDYYVAEFIGNGMMAGDESAGIEIDASAKVLFNLTGLMSGEGGYIEEPVAMPDNFDGFVIMTPETQTLDRVLVGGCGAQELSALPAFALTNAVTGATGTIEVNGEGVAFANKLLSLPHIDNKLMLTAADYSTIAPMPVANTTYTIYTNGVPVDATSIIVERGTPAYVTYTVTAEGYVFTNTLTTITYTCDTSVNPAKVESPNALATEIKDTLVVETETTEKPPVENPDPVTTPEATWRAATNAVSTVVVVNGMGLVSNEQLTNCVEEAKQKYASATKVTTEIKVTVTPVAARASVEDVSQIAALTVDVAPVLITTATVDDEERDVSTEAITEGDNPILISIDVSGFARVPILIKHQHEVEGETTTTSYTRGDAPTLKTFYYDADTKTVQLLMQQFSNVIIYGLIQVGDNAWADIYDDGAA